MTDTTNTKINIILKLNGISYLILGSLMTFIPQTVITFLSVSYPASEVVILITGMILNLFGMLVLWIGNKTNLSAILVKVVAAGDFMWVIFSFGLIFTSTWVTSTSGTTTTGLVAIIVGWLGWLQWQYSNSRTS